jgi:adenylate kinase family enzyme
MEKIYTIILIGISGAGKGTQASLIRKYIKENDIKNSILHLETGRKFRELMSTDGYTQEKVKEVNLAGKLQPDFLAVWNWSDQLVKGMDYNKHLIIDGTPRKLGEAELFHQAIGFYGRKNVCVINLSLSEEVAKQRLEERGRKDDVKEGDIERRFEWFKNETLPAIEYLKNIKEYRYLEVDGSKSIDDVQDEIIEFIND